MPLLTVFADLAGLAGGAAISILALDISPVQFIERVAMSTRPMDMAVGFIKAPVFALLIAATGTLRGMEVRARRKNWAVSQRWRWCSPYS